MVQYHEFYYSYLCVYFPLIAPFHHLDAKMRTISTSRVPSAAKLLNSLDNKSPLRELLSTLLPPALKKEIVEFSRRNILPDCGLIPLCCLKAHAIKMAKEMGYDGIVLLLQAVLPAQDHDGYYLDSDELKKID